MQDSINWKDRYSQLLSESEHNSMEYQQHSKVLQRLLSRATLAAEGQDPQLDKVLYNTRKNLAQLTVSDASSLADELEASLLEAENRQQQRLHSIQHSLLSMCEQMLQLKPAEKLHKSLNTYCNALNRTTTANHLFAQQLSDFSQLQQQVLLAAGQDDNSDTNYTSRQIQITLLQLLDSVSGNSLQQQSLTQLRERIIAQHSYPQLAQILDDLAHLMDSLYSSNQAEMKEYLAQLYQRLHQVGENLQQSQGQHQQGIELSADFDQQILTQVHNLGTELQGCDDLELLKLTIDQRINSFQQTLANYSQQRSAQESDLQERFGALQKRMQQMESQVAKANHLLAQQQHRSMLDQLTGIANRAAWDERIRVEHTRLQRSNEPLCLAIIDIDFFKNINDNYGHAAGDKVLKIFAAKIRENIRQSDFFARYGGEEFVLLLVNTALPQAVKLVDKLRQIIEDTAFHFKGQPVHITFSAGVGQLTASQTAAESFDLIDQALYQAKDRGRNIVVSTTGQTSQ